MLTRSRSRARDPHEEGVTLVELLIVLVLLGIVGSIVVSVITTGLRNSTTITNRTEAIHDVETSLQRVSREIRVADPLFISNDPHRELAVTIERGGELQLVRFQADSDDRQLLQLTQPFSDTALGEIGEPIGPGSTRLVTDLDNIFDESGGEALQPVFTYYDGAGRELECDLDSQGTPTDAPACRSILRDAEQVGVRIVKEVRDSRPIDAQTKVSIRSIRYRASVS